MRPRPLEDEGVRGGHEALVADVIEETRIDAFIKAIREERQHEIREERRIWTTGDYTRRIGTIDGEIARLLTSREELARERLERYPNWERTCPDWDGTCPGSPEGKEVNRKRPRTPEGGEGTNGVKRSKVKAFEEAVARRDTQALKNMPEGVDVVEFRSFPAQVTATLGNRCEHFVEYSMLAHGNTTC